MKVYKHIRKDIKVYEDEAQDYAMEQLGIIIKPLDTGSTYTLEQMEFLTEFTEWYFSGNWFKDEEKEAM